MYTRWEKLMRGCVLYMSLCVDVFYTCLWAWMCFIHLFVPGCVLYMSLCAVEWLFVLVAQVQENRQKKHLFRKQKHKQLSRNKHFTNKKYAFILCQLFVIVIPFSRKLFFYHFVRWQRLWLKCLLVSVSILPFAEFPSHILYSFASLYKLRGNQLYFQCHFGCYWSVLWWQLKC